MNGQTAKTITLHIRGMFCAHCEETVRKALEPAPGVLSVDVSREKEQAVVRYDAEGADVSGLRLRIEEAGYEVVSEGETKLQIVSVLVLLMALYIIAQRMGLAQFFSFFLKADVSLGIGALFVTGLLTSVHCIAMLRRLRFPALLRPTGRGRGRGGSSLVIRLLLPAYLWICLILTGKKRHPAAKACVPTRCAAAAAFDSAGRPAGVSPLSAHRLPARCGRPRHAPDGSSPPGLRPPAAPPR